MNRILFREEESPEYLWARDPRYLHIKEVLRAKVGDSIRIGELEGRAGTAKVMSIDKKGISLSPSWTHASCGEIYPVHVLLGHPRPAVLYRIIKDLCTLGVASISVTPSDYGEASYLKSKFWKEGRQLKALVEGASQAGVTRISSCTLFSCLDTMLEETVSMGVGICLDEDAEALFSLDTRISACRLAIGPERGWSEKEQEIFHAQGFMRRSLGPRIMRTETACTAAASHAVRHMHERKV